MTYKEFIQNIIDTRGRFNCGNEYYERHHIIPKCLGGTNEEENLIDLFAREHYDAHKLLALENPDSKGLQCAWWFMSTTKNAMGKRYHITAEEYEEARKRFVETPISDQTRQKMSESQKGRQHSDETRDKIRRAGKERCKNPENCSMYGKHHSEETKQKIREGQKNKTPISKETREKMRMNNKGENNPMYGKHPSEESRKRMSESQKGHPVSEETRRKIGESNKGKLAGKNNPHAREVLQFDLNDCFIQAWTYATQAAKELGIDRHSIGDCCRGKIKTSGGFKWRYKDEYEQEQLNNTTE